MFFIYFGKNIYFICFFYFFLYLEYYGRCGKEMFKELLLVNLDMVVDDELNINVD